MKRAGGWRTRKILETVKNRGVGVVNLLWRLLTPLVMTAALTQRAFTIETECVEVSGDLLQNLPQKHWINE